MDLEAIIQYSAANEREARALANSLAVRISTWVLAGHGAALLLCFNAVVAHHICHWPAVRPLAFLFLVGLGAAFISVVLTMWSFEQMAARMMQLNARMSIASSHAGLVQQINATPREEMDVETASRYANIATDRDAKARAEVDEMTRIADVPKWERRLPFVGNIFLGASVIAFGAALFMAIWSDQLAGALCPSAL